MQLLLQLMLPRQGLRLRLQVLPELGGAAQRSGLFCKPPKKSAPEAAEDANMLSENDKEAKRHASAPEAAEVASGERRNLIGTESAAS